MASPYTTVCYTKTELFVFFPATFTIKRNPFYVNDDDEDDESGIILKVKSKDADSIEEVDITEEEQGTYKVTYLPQTPGRYEVAKY